MKKLLSIILIVFIFLLSISDCFVVFSRTNYKFTISVSNSVCYKSDAEVSVNVYFENVPQIGVACGILKLKYDTTCLSFKGFQEGDIHHKGDSIAVNDYDGNLIINYINSFTNMAIVRDGKLVQLIFKINNGIEGVYPIELNNRIEDFAGIHIDEFGDSNYVMIDPQPEFVPGSIKIISEDAFVTPTPTNTATPKDTPTPTATQSPANTLTPTPTAKNSFANTPATTNADTPTLPINKSETIAVTSSIEVITSTPVATSEPSPSAIVAASSVDLVNDIIHIYPGKNKIQDIVSNALPGSTILISKGEYKENIIISNKNIKIIAENNDPVSIDASGRQRPVLTLKNCNNIDITGIMLIGGVRGIQIENSDNIHIFDCIIKDNSFEGINMTDSSSDNTIKNCEIYNNTTGVDLGDFNGQDNNTIESCKIHDNKEFGVKGLTKTTGTKVLKSQIFGNKRAGIFIGGEKWIIENNYIYDNLEAAILVDSEADAIIKGNKICLNSNGVYLKGKDTTLTENIIENNINVGIEVFNNSSGNVIYRNILSDSPYLAIDNGKSTSWYKDECGNQWNNTSGPSINKGSYAISGKSGSVDKFPQNKIEIVDVSKPEGTMKISDIKDHWAFNDIQSLIDRKIVAGYSDSTIRPDKPITRYEIVTIIVKVLKAVPKEKKTDCFNDINALWARDYVATAFELGFISGYEDNSFRGTNNVTRAEALVMLLRAAKLKESNTKGSDFIDSSDIPKWAMGYYNRAIESGWIKGYADKTLRPNNNITRAEVFTLINKIF